MHQESPSRSSGLPIIFLRQEFRHQILWYRKSICQVFIFMLLLHPLHNLCFFSISSRITAQVYAESKEFAANALRSLLGFHHFLYYNCIGMPL